MVAIDKTCAIWMLVNFITSGLFGNIFRRIKAKIERGNIATANKIEVNESRNCDIRFGLTEIVHTGVYKHKLESVKTAILPEKARFFRRVTHAVLCDGKDKGKDNVTIQIGGAKFICNPYCVMEDNNGEKELCQKATKHRMYSLKYNQNLFKDTSILTFQGDYCMKDKGDKGIERFKYYFWPAQYAEVQGDYLHSTIQVIFLFTKEVKINYERKELIVFKTSNGLEETLKDLMYRKNDQGDVVKSINIGIYGEYANETAKVSGPSKPPNSASENLNKEIEGNGKNDKKRV